MLLQAGRYVDQGSGDHQACVKGFRACASPWILCHQTLSPCGWALGIRLVWHRIHSAQNQISTRVG